MTDSLKRLKERSAGRSAPGAPSPAAGGPPTDFFAFTQPMAPMGGVRKISLALIDPWRDDSHDAQPFRLYAQDKLLELADNIRQNGVITPVRLRVSPYDSARYQTLAGHNRIAAARLAGLSEIDAVVENVDDDQARLILVDSNLYQREKLLPSEKAFAYKMKLETLKHQGRATSSQVGTKQRSDDLLADSVGESRMQIQRYIRLTYLLPELLDLVDEEAIPFTAGVSLSFLGMDAQRLLLDVLRRERIRTVSRSQAEGLKALGKDLTEDAVLRVFGRGPTAPKPQSLRFDVDLPPELFRRYRKDAGLRDLIAETIRNYIEEREKQYGERRF